MPTLFGEGMNIEKYGDSKRCRVAKELFERAIDRLRLVFLPIPTSKDGKHLNCADKTFENLISETEPQTLVVGYKIPKAICDEILNKKAKYIDLSLDEQFLVENAKISAEGALGYVLTSSEKSVSDMKIGIVGYGRIGKELFRLLSFMGGDLKIFTSSESTAKELGGLGVKTSLSVGGVRDFSGLDIVINTAPTDLSPSFNEGKIPEGMRVIELASGENFKGVKGIERLPSIPEKMYHYSGGYIYFKAITRFLKEEQF